MDDKEKIFPLLKQTFDGKLVHLVKGDRVLIPPPDWTLWPKVLASELGSDEWKTGPPPLIGPPDDIKPKKRRNSRG